MHPRTPLLLLGLLLMAVGLVFGLDNLGLIDAGRFLRFWPLILVLGGLFKLLSPGCRGAGLFWVMAGSLLLVHTLDVVAIWDLWPFVLVLIGGSIAYRALRPHRRRCRAPRPTELELTAALGGRSAEGAPPGATTAEASGAINVVALMGGVERTISVKDFRAASVVALMGGCEIDLRGSTIEGGEAIIDTTAVWGGIELRVPSEWYVESRGQAFLGGFEDKTHGSADASQRLVVTGLAVMGGIEIRN